MKKAVSVAILILALSVNALALEVPTDISVQNLNGSQMCVKTYTVSASTDPQSLVEEPFEFESYTYTYATITKQENRNDNSKAYTQTVTVETGKKDLSAVLAALSPCIEYQDGGYQGTLNLDHTTIQTQAAGYAKRSYNLTEIKEIEAPTNDMSYIPATTVKNGMTLNLAGVDWQVQGTALVDDVLVPTQYKAVATYAAKASYSAATGYISTAEYTGTVTQSAVESVTYTLTYLGTKTAPTGTLLRSQFYWLVAAGIGLSALVVVTVLLVLSRREITRLHAHLRDQVVGAEYREAEEME